VWLPNGSGALVGVTTSPGQQALTGGARYVLVAGPSRYALASSAVAASLGYTLSTQSTLVPVNIVRLIPPGPVLDPVNARLPVSQQAAGTVGG
jgi:ESX secretion system ATPase EccB